MLRCHFCKTPIDGVPKAIDAGWIPSFYIGPEEQPHPVCAECINAHLALGTDDEWELPDQPRVVPE